MAKSAKFIKVGKNRYKVDRKDNHMYYVDASGNVMEVKMKRKGRKK